MVEWRMARHAHEALLPGTGRTHCATARAYSRYTSCAVSLPLLVIDGREIGWDQFGRMLMSYEGWQFKLTIADKSEEL